MVIIGIQNLVTTQLLIYIFTYKHIFLKENYQENISKEDFLN